jgi:hypothetical protein
MKVNLSKKDQDTTIDYRTNIVRYAQSSKGVVPYAVMASMFTDYMKRVHKEIIYFEDNVYYSSVFLLCCDKWDEDIVLGPDRLDKDFIMSAATTVLRMFEMGISAIDGPPVALPLDWDIREKEEDSQAKLLYQSLLHFGVFNTEGTAVYYGSGTGDSYATSVLRSHFDNIQRDYLFIDPQTVIDVQAAPTSFQDGALVDIYDHDSVYGMMDNNFGMTIKSTTVEKGTFAFDYYVGKKETWLPVYKPFHPEGMLLTVKNFLSYASGFLRQKNQYNCGCFNCRAMQYLSNYYDFVWLYSSLNTPNNHRFHMWKLPGLTRYEGDMAQRFGNAPADTDLNAVSSYLVGKVVDFGSGDKVTQSVVPFDDNKRRPPAGHVIRARMSLHHDPSMFLYCSLSYNTVIIQDEMKNKPGRYWNHVGRYYDRKFFESYYVTRGYKLVLNIGSYDYTMVFVLDRGKVNSRVMFDIFFTELPLYLQPVTDRYQGKKIDGFDFVFEDRHYFKHGSVVLRRYNKNNNLVNFSVDAAICDDNL